MHYDLFNGDADGIIALLQLRKNKPLESTLITGVKRDIKLLNKIQDLYPISSATVLDLSLKKNLPPLLKLLKREIPIFYCDHHHAGKIPSHPNLTTLIDPSSETCTSLLISQKLNHQFIDWAIAATFGDNLIERANSLAQAHNISKQKTHYLQELGTLLNYNSYGSELSDLNIPPHDLFLQLMKYEDPYQLLQDCDSPYHTLQKAYHHDLQKVEQIVPYLNNQQARVFLLPDQKWSRRISGIFGNRCVYEVPEQATAVLTLNSCKQSYTVSLRAPLTSRTGADIICGRFPSGGGRAAAAGINHLPLDNLDSFVQEVTRFYTL